MDILRVFEVTEILNTDAEAQAVNLSKFQVQPAAFNAAQAMQARDLGLTRPVKDGDDSGGAGSGGNPGACEKNEDHGSKATVLDNELYKEGNAEAETKQKELRRAKRAKRNAMKRVRKRESRYKPGRVPRETFKVLLLPTKVMKARTLVMEQATGQAAVWHSKMRSKQNGSEFPIVR